MKNWIFSLLLWLFPMVLNADTIRVAVASNFSVVMQQLVAQFNTETGHTVTLIPGSSGKLFAQILHGAPFDAFFSADSARPKQLEQDGLTVPDSRFTYALGRLVLWSPKKDFILSSPDILSTAEFAHLAIANPRLAPYGLAAQQTLSALNLWQALQNKLVRGENISQTFQFVQSGNAKLGFIALSQLRQWQNKGSYWLVPVSMHEPIEQQAVLLTKNPVAQTFFEFIKSPAAMAIIVESGYDTP